MRPQKIKGFGVLITIVLQLALWKPVKASDINFGFLAPFSGPNESISQVLANGMQLALLHINEQGGLHGGKNAVQVMADSQCSSKTKAISAAERLIGSEAVVGIVGGLCSGATLAAAQGFSIPTGTPMVTPASLSPAITGLLDNDLLYRTVATNDRRIDALALLLEEEALEELSLVHLPSPETNELLKELQDLLDGERPFAFSSHELETKDPQDLDEAVNWMEKNGGDLIILDDLTQNPTLLSFLQRASGLASVRHIYISGNVDQQGLLETVGPADHHKVTLVITDNANTGFSLFSSMATRAGLDPAFPFLANTYDATFILALAMELTHMDQSTDVAKAIRSVANQPGETILPGEWGKAIDLIKKGEPINYEGASGGIEFDEHGDLNLSYAKAFIDNGKFQFQEIPH